MQQPDAYTAFTRRIIDTNFGADGSNLLVDGIPIDSIADEYGTPLFVYSRRVLDIRLEDLRRTFPGRFHIHYSVKANPNPLILRHLVSSGCGLEIASAGEYDRAISAGCNPADIIFAGPGKTPAELEKVIASGIGELHIESLREAQRAAEIGTRVNTRVSVAIRVNPAVDDSAGAMRMGGKPAPFGVDEECLEPVLDFVTSQASLHFKGIHLFVGTQILDAEALLGQYRKGLEIALRASARCGCPIRTLDLGGGLGIPYFPGDNPLDLGTLRVGLAELLQEVEGLSVFGPTRFVIEPGRFLVGESGIYIARVNDVKTSRGRKFVVLDGGMNHHLAASGNLGQTIKRNFPIDALTKLGQEPAERVDVVGPLCTPLDTLGRQVPLPAIEPGDLIGIFQSGAYARSASPLEFLSHPPPGELLVDPRHSGTVASPGDKARASDTGAGGRAPVRPSS
jgi:diaminopimelate decarboxylase